MKYSKTLVPAVLAAFIGAAGPSATAQTAVDATFDGYPPATDPTPSKDRITVRVLKSERGTSKVIDDKTVVALCADLDGCSIRLGMYNWDNSGKVASSETLFFLNSANRQWRGSVGDAAGIDGDAAIAHVLQVNACYFTDGRYSNFTAQGDPRGFELLSWNQYTAECWLTIID